MALPRTLPELLAVPDEDLPSVLFQMLEAVAKTRPIGKEGWVDVNDALYGFYPQGSVSIHSLEHPVRIRISDAFQELCARGFFWFNAHSAGIAGGRYEFTRKGRNATPDDISSPWYSSSAAVLQRFPEHATWDETMGAYFRMAVATHQAGVSEAALFLIGGAAERLIGLTEERVAHLLRPGWERRKAGERLTALVDLFRSNDALAASELIQVVGNVARWSRNDVGHPKPAPPDVDPAMVAARIWEFPGYVSRVLQAAGALAAR